MSTSPHVADLLQPLTPDEAQLRQTFYATLDEGLKAEWINGEMIVHSPVRLQHGVASLQLVFLINLYLQLHPLGKVFHEKVLIQLTRNAYEPDACFFTAARAAVYSGPIRSSFLYQTSLLRCYRAAPPSVIVA